jgi:hypothetical protein
MYADKITPQRRRRSFLVLPRSTDRSKRRLSIVIVALTLVSQVSIFPHIFHPVQASGIVYLNNSATTASANNIITVQVQVAGLDPFSGWDIQVKANQSVINPTSLSIKGNTLEANYSQTVFEIVNCINGVNYTTSHCDSSDGPGIVHSAAVAQQTSPSIGPVYGLLLTINYTVIRAGSYSPLQLLRAIISDGPRPVTVTTRDGSYGIPPGQGFDLAISPGSARIVIGFKTNVTITVSSFGGYQGMIDLTSETPNGGLTLFLNATNTQISSNHFGVIALTIKTNTGYQPSEYRILVTGTSNGDSHTASVFISTTSTPDFTLRASPSVLEIHSDDHGRSTIAVDTQSGFSGPVWLNAIAPAVPGLEVSLSSRNLMISAGSPASTVLDIRTPESAIPFVYLVNVSAIGPSFSDALTIAVRPPAPDFGFLSSNTEFVVEAGHSLTCNVTITSVDYFKGHLHLFASLGFGAIEEFSRPDISLDFGDVSISAMTLTIDANSVPGKYNVTLTALGTTFLGVNVTHSIIMTVAIISSLPANTILGLQPLTYYSIVGVLSALGVAVVHSTLRKLKRTRSQVQPASEYKS